MLDVGSGALVGGGAYARLAHKVLGQKKEKGGGRRGGLWKTKDFFFFHFYPNSDKGKNVFIILIYSIIVY